MWLFTLTVFLLYYYLFCLYCSRERRRSLLHFPMYIVTDLTSIFIFVIVLRDYQFAKTFMEKLVVLGQASGMAPLQIYCALTIIELFLRSVLT